MAWRSATCDGPDGSSAAPLFFVRRRLNGAVFTLAVAVGIFSIQSVPQLSSCSSVARTFGPLASADDESQLAELS